MQPTQQYKLDKAKRITEAIAALAETLAKALPRAYPRKRPRICKRMPARAHAYRRACQNEKIAARFEALLSPFITAAQIHLILSQPIPKYKPGAPINASQAIIGEYGEETIQRPGNTDGTTW